MTDLAFEQAFSIGMGETGAHFPTTLDRLIYLRTLPTLGGLAGRGLTYIAEHAIERHFGQGELIYRPQEPVSSVHFIVDGRVRVEQEGLHLLDGVSPFAIGFLPVLASSDVGQTATALVPTVTLEVSRADLFEIFEDDFGFLENGIRQLSRQLAQMQAELEARGALTRSEPEETPYPSRPLDLVERLELIRGGPYAEVNLEPLVQLVRQADELRFEPGDVLWEEGEPATWGAHVIHGVVACTSASRSFRMGPKSLIGFIEANGAMARGYRAVAETRVVALEQTTEVFLDVLEDHFDLAIGYLSFLSKLMLGLSVRVAAGKVEQEEE